LQASSAAAAPAQEFSGLLAEDIRTQFPSERRADRLSIVR
jgi:hypothetical protein